MNALPWVILFLPLLAVVVITLFTQHDRKLSGGISIAAVVIGFVLSAIFIGTQGWQPASADSTVTWLAIGDLRVDFGLHFDPLSLLMMLVVTGVKSPQIFGGPSGGASPRRTGPEIDVVR